jgi:hypothetical protein
MLNLGENSKTSCISVLLLVHEAVLGLNSSAQRTWARLRCSSSRADWKALMADDECSEFVFAYVRRFWRSKMNPELWITGLLKALEKLSTRVPGHGHVSFAKTDGPSALLPKRTSGGKPVQGHGSGVALTNPAKANSRRKNVQTCFRTALWPVLARGRPWPARFVHLSREMAAQWWHRS